VGSVGPGAEPSLQHVARCCKHRTVWQHVTRCGNT
jgi:hypothetical protein